MFRLLAVFIFFSSAGLAQDNPVIRVRKYTTKDGLSSNIVYRSFKDSYGFLWLTTPDGLNRFDGKDFKIYRNRQGDTTSIPGNIVYRIAEDTRGDLWIMTSNGLCKYLRSRNYFISFNFPWIDRDEKQYSTEPSLLIVKDKVWFTDYEGVNALEVATHRVKRYKLQEPYKGRHLISLGKDFHNRIFAGSTDGTFLLNEYTGVFEKVRTPYAHSAPVSFYIGSDNSLWLSVWLDAVLNIKDSLSHVIKYGGNESMFQVFEVGRDSFLACGDYPGLLAFSRNYPVFKPVSLLNKETGVEESSVIYSISSFDSSFVWLCSNEGLLRWDRRPETFQAIKLDTSIMHLPLKINALVPDPIHPDEIWINVWYQNLLRYNLKTGKTTYFFDQKNSPLTSLSWGYILGLYAHADGSIWVTGQSGIWRFDRMKGDFFQLRHPNNEASLIHNPCYRILKISNGNLIAIVMGKGLVEFNEDLSYYREYKFDFDDLNVRDLSFGSVIEKDERILLLSSGKSGLYSLDRNTGKYNRIIEDQKGVTIPGHQVMLEKDKTGKIWIGTLEKIVLLDKSNTLGQIYTTQNGLASNRIQYLFRDSQQTMWISTKNGLSYLNAGRNTFRNFTDDDGLLSNESYCLSEFPTGDIAVAHDEGISILKRSHLNESAEPPLLHFTELRIGDKEYPVGISKLTVSPGQSPVQIRFAAIDFAKSENITYSYKLEGVSEWQSLGNSNMITFYELPSGNYLLKVNAISASGIHSKDPVTLEINVLTPFYKTWWFVTLSVIVVGSIGFGYNRVKRQKRKELEGIRGRISRDLHDDIGSTLSSISMLSRSAGKRLADNDGKNLSEYLVRISERSTRLLDNMNDIIWSVRPENDSLENVLSRMREYASSILEAREIAFELDFPDHTGKETLSLDLKNNLFMIFKEALNNCLKYSECSHVSIRLKYGRGGIELTIADNGKGFDPSVTATNGSSGGNGLPNMRKRAEEVGAFFEVESYSGRGTTVRFRKVTH